MTKRIHATNEGAVSRSEQRGKYLHGSEMNGTLALLREKRAISTTLEQHRHGLGITARDGPVQGRTMVLIELIHIDRLIVNQRANQRTGARCRRPMELSHAPLIAPIA